MMRAFRQSSLLGQDASQVTWRPSGHTVTAPAQSSKRQPACPALPALQASVQLDPLPQLAEQLSSAHSKWHSLSLPQPQWPLEQTPLHSLSDPHCTWQGPAWQSKLHDEPDPHAHSPLAHVPAQSVFEAQSTWHGGASHVNPQDESEPQLHSPLAHAPSQRS